MTKTLKTRFVTSVMAVVMALGTISVAPANDLQASAVTSNCSSRDFYGGVRLNVTKSGGSYVRITMSQPKIQLMFFNKSGQTVWTSPIYDWKLDSRFYVGQNVGRIAGKFNGSRIYEPVAWIDVRGESGVRVYKY